MGFTNGSFNGVCISKDEKLLNKENSRNISSSKTCGDKSVLQWSIGTEGMR